MKVTLNLSIIGFKTMSRGGVEVVAKAQGALSLLLTGGDLMNNQSCQSPHVSRVCMAAT